MNEAMKTLIRFLISNNHDQIGLLQQQIEEFNALLDADTDKEGSFSQ